ncbi:hypothetical protein AOQ84DRAFT_97627 [Glonium stellatum]|uniref:Uncharacterized protein n=1 Tax=Glonium stellatum TaxID=574774 RepID=A0A8E2JQL0_9PEZI|nr:hypothetical protein AOQ84DRAFT_97627 [Glonium stellatum]
MTSKSHIKGPFFYPKTPIGKVKLNKNLTQHHANRDINLNQSDWSDFTFLIQSNPIWFHNQALLCCFFLYSPAIPLIFFSLLYFR